FMVYADFAVAAALLAMIIPKPSETPFYEQFEKAVNSFQFGGSGVTTVLNGNYTEYSGNADDLLRGESILLYYVRTNDPVYYKTQVFDKYDPEMRAWYSEGDEVMGDKSWQDKAELLSFERLSEAIEAAAEERPEIYEEYPTARSYEGISDSETFSVIYTRDFSAIYVLAPLRIKDAAVSNIGAKYSCRSDKGEVFTNLYRLPQGMDYTVRYYSEDIFDKLIEAGACDISFEDYGDLLWQAYLMSPIDSEYSNAANEFYSEYAKASKYKRDNETAVSEEIQALADKLTEGMEYDWQKAAVLAEYFHKGDFVYNLAYQAPAELDTPEYFLFESKTGTCSDFATAYTLLARAAGLTVRYVEGFTTTQGQNPQPGIYYIYSENAHAYPEVYIPGAGWRVYEPTVPSNLNRGGSGETAAIDYTAVFLTAAIAIVVFAIFILLVIFYPKITEGFFRASLLFCGSERAIRKLYLRHAERLGARADIDPLPMTLEEVSAVTVQKTDISFDPVSKPLGRHCYGGQNITKEERKAAYECYKSQYKKLTKRKSKK
ncbi:MAG: transglutaminase-like domain-containing protein, partial [Oscillospiraceae bacterium]|nr:transglutaminase-like domain-containing protein [Oscillospiraceae bacterium]